MDKRELANAWILAHKIGYENQGYDEYCWAVNELIEKVHDDPEIVWDLILEIIMLDNSEDILNNVGAGPLEDLMVYHGEKFIDRIEQEAANSLLFQSAMQSVWLDSEDTTLCNRFYEIAGIQKPFKEK